MERAGFLWPGHVAGCRKYGNEPSVSIKRGDFPHCILKKESFREVCWLIRVTYYLKVLNDVFWTAYATKNMGLQDPHGEDKVQGLGQSSNIEFMAETQNFFRKTV